MHGLLGDVDVWSDDGRIEVRDVAGGRMSLHSDDGRIFLANVSDRSIAASADDGSITLQLSGTGNATVVAATDDGSARLNGTRLAEDGPASPIRLGAGLGRIRLTTEDGSIHVMTNGST